MDLKDGLLIGIDIAESDSMAAFYDAKEAAVKNIMFADARSVLSNPLPLSKWPEAVRECDTLSVENMVSHMASLIEAAKRITGNTTVRRVCVCVEHFEKDVLDCIAMIFDRLAFKRSCWSVIGTEESFAYYAYNQKKELYSPGVLLLDYQKEAFYAHLMSNARYDNNDIIMENSYKLEDKDVSGAYKLEGGLPSVQQRLIEWLTPIISQRPVASVYLTGEGFDVERYPEALTKFLCNRRRVFAGQNLYVKGAAFCAYEETNEAMQRVIMACRNRVSSGIDIDILERGVPKRLRVIKPGVNWYEAGRKLDFIVDDAECIRLLIRPCNGASDFVSEIDISEISYRKKKMTRISVEFAFVSDSKCTVIIRDKGFGEFVKATDKIITYELDL